MAFKNKEKVSVKNGIYYYQNAWKQKTGTMTKVYVKGTDYERGVRFGILLADDIRKVIKNSLFFIFFARKTFPAILRRLFKRYPLLLKPILLFRYKKKVDQRLKKYPQWWVREIEGTAEGANLDAFYLKLLNVIGDNPGALGDSHLNSLPTASCCSFAFMGQDGNICHGKNLDWVLIEDNIDLICLQQREDENGDWFSIIGPPGLLSSFEFGINSHGISIALTGRFYRGKQASRQVLTNIIQLKILREAKNLKDIQKIYNTGTGFDRADALLISSLHDRNHQLFETTPKGAAVTSAKDGKLFNTNTYVHKVFQSCNRQWGTIYQQQFCDPRHLRLQELMAKNPQTMEDAFKILADTQQPGFQHNTFLGQATINRFITHVSVLMVQGKNPGVWIARNRTYAAYNEYVFFDYSCLPRENLPKRPAHPLVSQKTFKTFKEFMHLRETRYYVSPGKLFREGRKLLDIEPENPVYILFLAQNYLKYHRFHRALAVLDRHTIDWCADYWYCLGQCYCALKQYEKAKESFLKAITQPPIEGFPQMVHLVCLVQLVKINTALGLTHQVNRLKNEISLMQSKFSTPNIGMPDYPYINNICEQLENIIL